MREKVSKSFKLITQFVIANKSLSMKILAGIIVIIAILVITSCFKGEKLGTSVGNSSNSGIAVKDGKWIYYVQVDNEKPVGIHKVNVNGKNTEKIIEGNVSYLNILDNYIYCLEQNEENKENNLIKIKTNGKNKQVLATNIDEKQITVADKWIYYYKDNNFYRVSITGTDMEQISDKNILYYQIDNKVIYYIYQKEGTQYIAKMKLNGEDSQRIAKIDSEQVCEALYVKNSKLYYVLSKLTEDYENETFLYEMNKKGEKVKKICKLDTNVQHINMQADKIYYTVTENYNEYLIKSIKYNGTDKTTIRQTTYISNINITDKWIIYLRVDENYENLMKMIEINRKKERNL